MSEENITSCITCGSDNISHSLDCEDYFVTQEIFKISKCNDCGFHFTNPRPVLPDIGKYYESDKYISHSKTSTGIVNRLFHLSRMYTLSYKKRVVAKYASGKNILDYGCGTGAFIHHMEKSSWNCHAIEPSSLARESAKNKCAFEITDESGLENIQDGSLDAITLWHVMEHIYPLHERLTRFRELLSNKGTLFVALPNMQSLDATKYGRHWAAWDVPRHVYHFNPETIDRLMATHGFERIDTRPMVLDAFYISLLSEKYMRGRSNFPRAFYNGLRSNLKAYFGNGSYSSLIYIFKKSN